MPFIHRMDGLQEPTPALGRGRVPWQRNAESSVGSPSGVLDFAAGPYAAPDRRTWHAQPARSYLDSPADRRKRPRPVGRPGGASAEHAALDFAAVVLER